MAFHEYPYTDFHEMNLDWVIAKVKELTLAWAKTSSDWEELRTFVTDYFANLNVQDEINNKMDELVSDGTLSTLIAPYVASGLPAEVANQIAAVVSSQIGAVVAAQLPAEVTEQLPGIAAQAAADEVSTWLETHVDPETGYVIDDSLTIAGAAADAKAAGDAITGLKGTINGFGMMSLEWEQGRFNNSGEEVSSSVAIRTKPITVTPGEKYIGFTLDDYSLYSYFWDANDEYLGSNEQRNGTDIIVPSTGVRMRLVYRHYPVDQTSVNTAMGDTVSLMKYGHLIADVTLSRNALQNNSNADEVTENGAWWVSSSNTYTGLPSGMTNGILIVRNTLSTSNNVLIQFAYSNNDGVLYYRYKISSGFVTGWNPLRLANTYADMLENVTYTEGYNIDAYGNIVENSYFKYSDLIPVTVYNAYTLVTKSNNVGTPRVRIHEYDSEGTWLRQLKSVLQPSGDTSVHNIPFMADGNAQFVRISIPNANTDTKMYAGYPTQKCGVANDNTEKLINSFSLYGKKISILGASISTYDGYIPYGYSAYYPHETVNANPVVDVKDTYWKKVIDGTGMTLLINNSSAGTYCTTGHGDDTMAGCGDRCVTLDDGNDNPDVIIIQLGGNDFTRSTPLGSYDGTQTFPVSTDTFREAYATMLKKITTKYKGAVVLCGTIPVIKGGAYVTETFPPKNKDQGEGKPGGIMLEEYNQAIRELANLFGCKIVEFSKCGLTFFNASSYMQDAVGEYGQHPNRLGHSMMANEVLHALGQEFGEVYPIK